MLNKLSIETIREAAERIRAHVVRPPLLCHPLRPDCELLLKPECLQPTGAFKLRGAFNLMCTLEEDCPGVVAHSSGNHAQAVAYAAQVLGIPATIVMPSDAPLIKRQRTEAAGATIITVGPDSEDRAARAAELAQKHGLIPVPPYDHLLITAGQGTSALELIEDAESVDQFYAPVSGGGLMAGCAVAVHALCPAAEIIGCEPEGADDTRRSLAAGERVSVPPPTTIADGLRVRIPGEHTWPVLQALVDRIEIVTDDEMLDAMLFAIHNLRLVLEPSGAAALALALREGRGRCGVLLSGGNVEPRLLASVVGRSLG